MSSTLLVTGGAGYIGSHTLIELIAAGYQPLVLDNLSNGSRDALRRVEEISGTRIPFVEGDLRTPGLIGSILADQQRQGRAVQCVLHLAGLKAVGESVHDPLKYFDNNVNGTLMLLDAMRRHRVRKLVFSSSATVYGTPRFLPFTEDHPLQPTNPYGRTKLVVEQMLQDMCAADSAFSAVTLRYFNPIGAHPSGLIGENPRDTPNNLFPFITQVAVGAQPFLKVFGNDYGTDDGTGVRDYLHVMDLAAGHVKAVTYAASNPGFIAINLGTGKGTSVLELVHTFEHVNKLTIPCHIEPRRAGDVDRMWADPGLARRLLDWRATRNIENMCQDGWRWQSTNPHGYPNVHHHPGAAAMPLPPNTTPARPAAHA